MIAARDNGVGLLVVASPQPFGSDATPGAWRRAYNTEWRELIEMAMAWFGDRSTIERLVPQIRAVE